MKLISDSKREGYPAFYMQKEQFLTVDFMEEKIYNSLE